MFGFPSVFSEERVSFTFREDNFAVTEKTFDTLPYQFFSLMTRKDLFSGCHPSLVYRASIITEARLQNVCLGLCQIVNTLGIKILHLKNVCFSKDRRKHVFRIRKFCWHCCTRWNITCKQHRPSKLKTWHYSKKTLMRQMREFLPHVAKHIDGLLTFLSEVLKTIY